jgi:proline racemase
MVTAYAEPIIVTLIDKKESLYRPCKKTQSARFAMHSARGWFGVTNKIENKILIGINFFVKNIKIFTLI